MARAKINDKHSLMYIANLYKFAAISSKAMQIKEICENHYLEFMSEVYRQMPMVIFDYDLRNIGVPTQTELLMHFISICLKQDRYDLFTFLFDYIEKMNRRVDKGELFAGEDFEEVDTSQVLLRMLGQFCFDRYKMKHSAILSLNDVTIPSEFVKELIKDYKPIGGKKDRFYKYMVGYLVGGIIGEKLNAILSPIWSIGSLTAKTVFRPIRSVGSWIVKHKLVIGIIMLFAFIGLLVLSKKFFAESVQTQDVQETIVQKPFNQPIKYLVVTTSQANVRSEAKLNSNVVTVVNQNEKLKYLNQVAQDQEGITWYKVETNQGKEGWISSKIVNWEVPPLTKSDYANQNKLDSQKPQDSELVKAVEENNLSLTKKLLLKGANPNAKSLHSTVLIYACREGYVDIVNALLDAGADVNYRDKYGTNALLSAVDGSVNYNDTGEVQKTDAESTAIVKRLLESGADPNSRYNDGSSALMLAVQADFKSAVKILLDAKADPNIQGYGGNTPLFYAISNPEIFKMLLSAGANPDLKNAEGETVKDLVKRYYQKEIAEMLGLSINVGTVNPSNQEVERIKSLLSPGMSKEQVEKVLGKNYVSGLEEVNGNYTVWRYDYPLRDYRVLSSSIGQIDLQGLANGSLQMQLFISWYEEDRIGRCSIYIRGKDNQIYNYDFAPEDRVVNGYPIN